MLQYDTQRRMAHYYNTKLFISLIVIFNFIISLYALKFYSFSKILTNIKGINKKYVLHKNSQHTRVVINLERKLSNLLRINKCFLSSYCIYKTLKEIGIDCKFIIGVAKENKDEVKRNLISHAWVEFSEIKDNNNDKFKKILILQ
tara:strand:- start:3194 stop:3628 length:435 start_codon:yes stop_codon:yes gene_type:complete